MNHLPGQKRRILIPRTFTLAAAAIAAALCLPGCSSEAGPSGALNPPAGGGASLPYGRFSGTGEVVINGTKVQAPVTFELSPASQLDSNPAKIFIQVGSEGQLGNAALHTAVEFQRPDWTTPYLQRYCSMEAGRSPGGEFMFEGSVITIANDTALGGLNGFYGPNPGAGGRTPLERVQGYMGAFTLNIMKVGSNYAVSVSPDGRTAKVAVAAEGSSITGLVSQPSQYQVVALLERS